MDRAYLDLLIPKLHSWGIQFEPGLSNKEASRIESTYGFPFPPDLRSFLQYGLPVSRGWINWREDAPEQIRARLNWPADGICFDIEHSNFWMENWGPRPNS